MNETVSMKDTRMSTANFHYVTFLVVPHNVPCVIVDLQVTQSIVYGNGTLWK